MSKYAINDTIWNRFRTVALYHLFDSNVFRKSIGRLLRNRGHFESGVYIVSSSLVIKTKLIDATSLSEANALNYIATHTSIPVPRVHTAFVHKGRFYILMDRIAGKRLTDEWIQRPPESKALILGQLAAMVRQMRALQPPDGVGVASVDGGPAFSYCQRKDKWGPYSMREFHTDLRYGHDLDSLELQNDCLSPKEYEHCRNVMEWHNRVSPIPVFTHGDLTDLNIMAQGDVVTGIIDWEAAGWWPSYWEYSTAMFQSPGVWQKEVPSYIEPPPEDDIELDRLRRRFWGQFG